MPEIDISKQGFKGPLLLTGFFETTLQQHFSAPSHIFDPDLTSVLWKPGNNLDGTTETAIYIGVGLKPEKQTVNFRPAILIHRGDWRKNPLGIHGTLGLRDRKNGDKIDAWIGIHTFTCLTKSFASVEILAHEVATFFNVYGIQLADAVCIDNLQVSGISAPRILQEDNESYMVSVSVSYEHHNHWALKQNRPPIRHIRPVFQIDGI